MNYVEILLKLNKSKKILFSIFLIFMISGHLMQKYSSKNYEFTFDIFFPTDSFLIFSSKQEVYKNFQSSFLTKLVKKDYTIKKKQNFTDAYNISTTLTEGNSEYFIKKKKEITDIFKLEKKNLIRWIDNNHDITSITLNELQETQKLINLKTQIKLELMWIELEKKYVVENITEFNNIKFSEELTLKNNNNYYSIMMVMFIAYLTLYTSYLIVTDDYKKKVKQIRKKIK